MDKRPDTDNMLSGKWIIHFDVEVNVIYKVKKPAFQTRSEVQCKQTLQDSHGHTQTSF